MRYKCCKKCALCDKNLSIYHFIENTFQLLAQYHHNFFIYIGPKISFSKYCKSLLQRNQTQRVQVNCDF